MTSPAKQTENAAAASWRRWNNQIAGVVALGILVAGYLAAPEAKLDRLGHVIAVLGATTGGQMIYAALVALAVAVLRWALAKVPSGPKPPSGGAALLLALALGASTLSGCTAAQLRDVVSIAKPIVKWSCGIAGALCGKDDAEACAVLATVCGIADPLLDALPIEPAPTSGGEDEPHTIDGEDGQ